MCVFALKIFLIFDTKRSHQKQERKVTYLDVKSLIFFLGITSIFFGINVVTSSISKFKSDSSNGMTAFLGAVEANHVVLI